MENERLENELAIPFESGDYIKSEIEGKKTIFFDLMIWNYFADEKIPIFNEIKKKVIDLVKKNNIICPISVSLIVEAATGIIFRFCQQNAKELCTTSSPSPDSFLTALHS
jgi:hypothetical protein